MHFQQVSQPPKHALKFGVWSDIDKICYKLDGKDTQRVFMVFVLKVLCRDQLLLVHWSQHQGNRSLVVVSNCKNVYGSHLPTPQKKIYRRPVQKTRDPGIVKAECVDPGSAKADKRSPNGP